MTPLPVDSLLPQIAAAVSAHPCLVLEAPPGAGKTTRVPPALLTLTSGQVWVLEPRRIAARLAARRVASELNQPLGQTVGYQVRFEQVGGPATRLHYLTEGVLTRRMLSDPSLRAAGVVVLDEFHERHLDTDLALAWLRRLQQTQRPDLKIVVMSATLDASPIAAFLGDCPTLRSEGRLFDLEVRYRPQSADSIEELVKQSVESLLRRRGDILAFLPGAAEISRCQRALEPLAAVHSLLITPLHGDLSPEEQDRAVQPAEDRKVILATNVAESSITIDGVSAVIDSGLARVASISPWSGLPQLQVTRISQASATQRAGRAARTSPGTAIRLYPEEDLRRRPERDTPEIRRLDLSEMMLTLHGLGITSFDQLAWLDAPPSESLSAAERLLSQLGAINHQGAITSVGRAMIECPVTPRLARLVVEAKQRGTGSAGALAAALLSLGSRLPSEMRHATPSDVFALLEGAHPPMARKLASSVRNALRIPAQDRHDDDALRLSILAAFPDRVARRRQRDELLLAGGGSAVLAASSTVRNHPLLVALDIEERRERGLPLVRLASAIEPEWLLDLFPDRMQDSSGVEWNRSAERVESVSALLFDDLVIEESRGGHIDPEQAAALLGAKAREAGLARFTDLEEMQSFLARVEFANQHSSIPKLTELDAEAALAELCAGKRSFAELEGATRDGGLVRFLESKLNARLLDEIAPVRWKLPSGRTGKIEYAHGQPPRLAAKLQEFFGMKQTPRIANGKVPLVVLLLAPNQRPVQTTTDLAGFWERLYPELRRQLMRRYPKHSWPEM